MEPPPHGARFGASRRSTGQRAASRTPEGRNPTLNTMADATADSEALLITADGFEQLRSELDLLRTNGRREVS